MTTSNSRYDRPLDRVVVRSYRTRVGTNPYGGAEYDDVTERVWARRLDWSASDQLRIGATGAFTLADTRWIVRRESPAWAVDDEILDGDTRYIVKGLSEVRGRQRDLLEVLARSTG